MDHTTMADISDDNTDMAPEHFKAKDFGLKAQKKLLSRMSTKSTVKLFIDDRSASVLDNTYKLFKIHTANKKESEKLIKGIIKTVVKIAFLHRNRQFNAEEMDTASKLPQIFRRAVMTIASYYELDFSYDHAHLGRILNELHTTVRLLIQNQLTEKSLTRIDHVFQFLTKKEFCDSIFLGPKTSQSHLITDKIVADLMMILDEQNDSAAIS